MSSKRRHVLAGLAIGAALLTAGETRVAACSCIGPIVACESVGTAGAVFVGKVTELGNAVRGTREQPFPQRRVVLEVNESFKGLEASARTVELFTGSGGGDCGYPFVVGSTYLVFAHEGNGRLTASICSNTMPIEQAATDLAYLRGPFATPADLGVIRGTVMRHDPATASNLPLRRAPFGGAEIRLEGYSRAYNTTSADDGSYEFRVAAGEYRVFVRVRDGVYASPGPEGRTVELRDNRGCAVANVIVRPDSRIAGRLLDDAGRPVPFMSVELAPENDVQSSWLWVTKKILTDQRGRFEFTQLDPGRYAPGLTLQRQKVEGLDRTVWLSRDSSGQPRAIGVESGSRADLGDVRLPSGFSTLPLTGVVVGPEGTPISGADVRFAEAGQKSGMLGAPARTDDDGRFSMSVLVGRSYRLVAEWRSTIPGQRRYLSARSEPFDAVGEIKPFRLELADVR